MATCKACLWTCVCSLGSHASIAPLCCAPREGSECLTTDLETSKGWRNEGEEWGTKKEAGGVPLNLEGQSSGPSRDVCVLLVGRICEFKAWQSMPQGSDLFPVKHHPEPRVEHLKNRILHRRTKVTVRGGTYSQSQCLWNMGGPNIKAQILRSSPGSTDGAMMSNTMPPVSLWSSSLSTH